MSIKGFFIGDAGFVNARLVSTRIGIDESVEFLVDTGASKTTILDKDAQSLNIDYEQLRRFEQRLSGIGGSVETYIMDDAVLSFKSDKGEIEFSFPIFVVRHNLEKLSSDERVKVLSIPSIMGRDIITKFKMIYTIKKEDLIFHELKGLNKDLTNGC